MVFVHNDCHGGRAFALFKSCPGGWLWMKLIPAKKLFGQCHLFSLANYVINFYYTTVGSMEALSKAFLLFFVLLDWLKLNHVKSRIECGFSDIFSRHICSTVAETIGVTNNAASFGAKKCSENHI